MAVNRFILRVVVVVVVVASVAGVGSAVIDSFLDFNARFVVAAAADSVPNDRRLDVPIGAPAAAAAVPVVGIVVVLPPGACHHIADVVDSVPAAAALVIIATGTAPPPPPPLPLLWSGPSPVRRADIGGHGPAVEVVERRESVGQIESPFVAKGRATILLVPLPRGCPAAVVANDDDDHRTHERGSGDIDDAAAHALLGSSNDPFM
jgi:hypothetical protein